MMEPKMFGEIELSWIDPEEVDDEDKCWKYLCTVYPNDEGYPYNIVVNLSSFDIKYTELDLI